MGDGCGHRILIRKSVSSTYSFKKNTGYINGEREFIICFWKENLPFLCMQAPKCPIAFSLTTLIHLIIFPSLLSLISKIHRHMIH